MTQLLLGKVIFHIKEREESLEEETRQRRRRRRAVIGGDPTVVINAVILSLSAGVQVRQT